MAFAHKKTGYENIYQWEANAGNDNCFYCKQKKEKLSHILIGGDAPKGICEDCMKDFEIGHLGTDRHVVERIRPQYTSQDEARKWFAERGRMELVDIHDDGDGEDIYVYHFVNNDELYAEYQEYVQRLYKEGPLPARMDLEYSYNRVEVTKDGGIHIIY